MFELIFWVNYLIHSISLSLGPLVTTLNPLICSEKKTLDLKMLEDALPLNCRNSLVGLQKLEL